jgi:tRNA1Val (adenine37-N6)-methyltransferase
MRPSSAIFRFKQFSVKHHLSSLKVTTDAVLLGAWVDKPLAANILDIGTGSGVLALMMAQKYQSATIDAIDIDIPSIEEASFNFLQSPWSNRLSAFCIDFKNFDSNKKYDLIISNPPYFVDSLVSPNPQKAVAKHTLSLDYKSLVEGITKLITNEGFAYIVLPFYNIELLKDICHKNGLYIAKLCAVSSFYDQSPFLALVAISVIEKNVEHDVLAIRDSQHKYTPEYSDLTNDFYL